MTRSRLPLFMFLLIAAAGMFALPQLVATYAGSHTVEVKMADGASSLVCSDCHTYIVQEMKATTVSTDVYVAHKEAASNKDYLEFLGASSSLDLSNVPEESRTCVICHILSTNPVRAGHTDVKVRVCTDPYCHGSSVSGNGNEVYNSTGYVGYDLAADNDVHSKWFKGMEAKFDPSGYTSPETGDMYKAGYFTCLACHTHTGMKFAITNRPDQFIGVVNKEYDSALGVANYNVTGVGVDWTSTDDTVVYAYKQPGSIWVD